MILVAGGIIRIEKVFLINYVVILMKWFCQQTGGRNWRFATPVVAGGLSLTCQFYRTLCAGLDDETKFTGVVVMALRRLYRSQQICRLCTDVTKKAI